MGPMQGYYVFHYLTLEPTGKRSVFKSDNIIIYMLIPIHFIHRNMIHQIDKLFSKLFILHEYYPMCVQFNAHLEIIIICDL